MRRTRTVKEDQNCLVVSMSGDQTFVKIFDESGELIRQSEGSGATEIQHIVAPGKYTVESDGTIDKVSSSLAE